MPGGEIDAATSEEIAQLERALHNKVVSERVHAEDVALSDGTGAVKIIPYVVRLGMEFRLNRVTIEADGVTYAALFVNAAGSVTIQRGGQVLDGYNLSAGIPNTWTAGSGSAPRYRNGEEVQLVVVGGPANTKITARIEGDLFPDRTKGVN